MFKFLKKTKPTEFVDTNANNLKSIECKYCIKFIKFNIINQHEEDCIIEQLKQEYGEPIDIPSIPDCIECHICKTQIDVTKIDEHEYDCDIEMKQQQIKLEMTSILTDTQLKAVEYINNTNQKSLIPINHKLTTEQQTKLIQHLENAPITINFYPSNIARLLLKDTHYRNLFETGTSGGNKSLVSRKTWENTMFNNIYQKVNHKDRVKYGALNLTNLCYVNIASGYGDSYLLLHHNVKKRSTLTLGDSSNTGKNTYSFEYPNRFLNELDEDLITQIVSDKPITHKMSKYIEVQIHGDVKLDRDIFALVIDPKHQKTPVEEQLTDLCQKNNIILQWKDQI
jgi:hypothetical protein